MCVFLPPMGEMFADELQLLVYLHRLDDVGVGRIAERGGHEADGAGILTPKVARILVPSVSQVVHKGRGVEQRLCERFTCLSCCTIKHIKHNNQKANKTFIGSRPEVLN